MQQKQMKQKKVQMDDKQFRMSMSSMKNFHISEVIKEENEGSSDRSNDKTKSQRNKKKDESEKKKQQTGSNQKVEPPAEQPIEQAEPPKQPEQPEKPLEPTQVIELSESDNEFMKLAEKKKKIEEPAIKELMK